MKGKKYLTRPQVAALDAIQKRGENYDGPKQLFQSLSDDDIHSPGGLITSATTGLERVRLLLSLIQDDGSLLGDCRPFTPKYEKDFLRGLKKSPGGFEDLEKKILGFLSKNKKKKDEA